MISESFIIVRLTFAIVATVLFAVMLSTYLRFHNRRLLLITVGFAFFFAHAMFSLPEILNPNYDLMFDDTIHLLLDVAGLIIITLGTLQDVLFKKK